jgi:hypothetical protein
MYALQPDLRGHAGHRCPRWWLAGRAGPHLQRGAPVEELVPATEDEAIRGTPRGAVLPIVGGGAGWVVYNPKRLKAIDCF